MPRGKEKDTRFKEQKACLGFAGGIFFSRGSDWGLAYLYVVGSDAHPVVMINIHFFSFWLKEVNIRPCVRSHQQRFFLSITSMKSLSPIPTHIHIHAHLPWSNSYSDSVSGCKTTAFPSQPHTKRSFGCRGPPAAAHKVNQVYACALAATPVTVCTRGVTDEKKKVISGWIERSRVGSRVSRELDPRFRP